MGKEVSVFEEGGEGSSSQKDVKDAMLVDESGDMMISLWNEQIGQVKENVVYLISNVMIKEYFWKKLSTTNMTTFKVMEGEDVDFSKFEWRIMWKMKV